MQKGAVHALIHAQLAHADSPRFLVFSQPVKHGIGIARADPAHPVQIGHLGADVPVQIGFVHAHQNGVGNALFPQVIQAFPRLFGGGGMQVNVDFLHNISPLEAEPEQFCPGSVIEAVLNP